jgi:hypothetical protein
MAMALHRPDTRAPAWGGALRRSGLLPAAIGAPVLSLIVVVTAAGHDDPLGAPTYWPWLLTGLQVLALWAAGTGRRLGWLLGAAVQLPWIAYAIVTAQLGFIPGCAVSAVVQTHTFLSGGARSEKGRDTGRRRMHIHAEGGVGT